MADEGVLPRPARGSVSLRSVRRNEALQGYLFVLPFFALMAIFTLYVFVRGALLSLSSAEGLDVGTFTGLKNFADVFSSLFNPKVRDVNFWPAVRNTLYYAGGCLVTQIPAAFILAYILNRVPNSVKGVLRASFFLPVLLNSVIVSLLFRMLFNPDQGVINWVLGLLHLPNTIRWLSDSAFAIPLLIIVSFWQWTGFHMVYLLASLQTIQPSLYEAAKMDGASEARVLFRVVLPMLRSAFAFVMVTSAIGGLQMFDLVFNVFPEVTYGPGGSARTMVAHIFEQAFSQHFRLGYASAVGWVVFLIIFAVSLLQLRIIGLGSKEEE